MSQFNDLTIKEVVEKINMEYFIPDIQRGYVWLKNPKEKKIENLFDSLLRGYPISSFLIWKLKRTDIEPDLDRNIDGKLNIQLYKFIENYNEMHQHSIRNQKINIEQINSNDLYIVLDGQQRLTSLYIGLKGSIALKKRYAKNISRNYIEKKLYINLKYVPKDEEPDDCYEFVFLSEEEFKNEKTKHWFKVGNVLNMKHIDAVKYKNEKQLNDEETDILLKLVDIFCEKEKISYFQETDIQLEKVLNIFIRVNSGGMQLSYSDLLMSILTANFSSDIRDGMNNFIDELKDEGFGAMGRDQILKTSLLLTGSNHIFKLKNFGKENIHKIEENWGKIQENIRDAVNLLIDFGYRDRVSSGYLIGTIAYYCFAKGKINDADKESILDFTRLAQIKGYFSTRLDGKLSTISNIIKESDSFREFNKRLAQDKSNPLYISEEEIERFAELSYEDSAIFAILQMLYKDVDYKHKNFHIDHIFPKSKFNAKNNELNKDFILRANDLFNLQLLEGHENNIKRAKEPEIWLKEEYKTDDRIIEYKKRNYIKEDLPLIWQNIEEFEKSRIEKLIEKLKEELLKR
jgi:uncharacterized protein with ParB-like and HNH nuclease domain